MHIGQAPGAFGADISWADKLANLTELYCNQAHGSNTQPWTGCQQQARSRSDVTPTPVRWCQKSLLLWVSRRGNADAGSCNSLMHPKVLPSLKDNARCRAQTTHRLRQCHQPGIAALILASVLSLRNRSAHLTQCLKQMDFFWRRQIYQQVWKISKSCRDEHKELAQ